MIMSMVLSNGSTEVDIWEKQTDELQNEINRFISPMKKCAFHRIGSIYEITYQHAYQL